MAMLPLRLRRALTTLTSLRHTLPAVRPAAPPLLVEAPASTCAPPALSLSSLSVFQSRFFRSSAGLSDSSKSYKLYKEGDEITEDTILFEGCDYNHWLITVDFPRDNKPSREEMIRTYEEICAKGLGVSVEEAKKRIYACSTTTYEGFQVEMTEEESEKFHDVPGVVFVLPDSYIDPANKQYGGDKYENGVITPRPPPVTFGRNQRRDRRNPDRSGSPNWQRTPSPNQQGFMRGDGRNNEYPQRFVPSYQINYGQGSNFDYGQNHGYGSNPGHGQGSNSGYRQNNRQGPSAPHRDYGQGAAPGRGQNYEQPLGAGPSFTELVQQEGEGIQPIFPPFEQKGTNNDKGR